jgi:hypothetical protein
MPVTRSFLSLSLSLALVSLAACSKKPEPPPAAPPPPAATKPEPRPAAKPGPAPAAAKVEPRAAPAAAEAAPAVEGAGPAYFVVQNALVKLDGGKLSVEQPEGVRGVAVGPDGVVWVSSYRGVQRIAPGKAPEPCGAQTGLSDHLAPAKGELFATSYQGIAHWNGSAWSLEEKAKIGAGITYFNGLGLDAEGALWASTSDALFKREKGGSWKDASPADLVKAAKPYYSELHAGLDGALYVKSLKGAFRFHAGAWSKLPTGISDTLAAVAPDGRLLFTSYQGASIVTGGKRQRIAGIKAKSFRKAVADGAGRFWIATDYGIAIVGPDGKLLQQWEPGQLKEVSGDVRSLAVVGRGPSLPTLGAKAVGTVKGKILRGGSAVAGAIVELCESPSMILFGRGATPCAKAIFKASATTDAEGSFTIPGVPIGSYRFAVKAGPKWVIMFGGDCCAKMKEGQSYDIGAITLKER